MFPPSLCLSIHPFVHSFIHSFTEYLLSRVPAAADGPVAATEAPTLAGDQSEGTRYQTDGSQHGARWVPVGAEQEVAAEASTETGQSLPGQGGHRRCPQGHSVKMNQVHHEKSQGQCPRQKGRVCGGTPVEESTREGGRHLG